MCRVHPQLNSLQIGGILDVFANPIYCDPRLNAVDEVKPAPIRLPEPEQLAQVIADAGGRPAGTLDLDHGKIVVRSWNVHDEIRFRKATTREVRVLLLIDFTVDHVLARTRP